MKKIAFIYQKSQSHPWIGDKRSLEVLCNGLKTLGHEGLITDSLLDAREADRVFLTNIAEDLSPLGQLLQLQGIPYGIIPFHEDYLLYSTSFHSFFAYIAAAIGHKEAEKRIEALYKLPTLSLYHPFEPKTNSLQNAEVIENADICIANSHTEASIIRTYCPRSKPKIIYWTAGYLENQEYPKIDTFPKQLHLPPKGYILQIGRLEPRKNQLANILATRHLDIPLVFISTSIFTKCKAYAKTCIEAILRLRKAPTYIITNELPSMSEGPLHIVNIPGGLSVDSLVSAYQNAGLYSHPAFFELPGYTYLEAAKLGTPTIASSWGTIRDYFTDHTKNTYTLDSRIQYCKPYDIAFLEKQILSNFGKSYSPSNHPIFLRKEEDVARDFLKLL